MRCFGKSGGNVFATGFHQFGFPTNVCGNRVRAEMYVHKTDVFEHSAFTALLFRAFGVKFKVVLCRPRY